MPVVRDFRAYSFLSARVDRSGRYLGSKIYWKLYSIENTIRVVIHSVLSANIDPNWWVTAVDKDTQKNAQRFRKKYETSPKNASPGTHDIHLIFLSELTEILRANSHLFSKVVPDVDEWVVRLEAILMPRNLVGHMNFPNAFDRAAIDSAYSELPALLIQLRKNRVQIQIPR